MKEYMKPEKIKSRYPFDNTIQILKGPVAFLGQLTRWYGPIVTASFGGQKYFIIQHPDCIKNVLVDNNKAYYKPGATKILNQFLGEGLVTSNGDNWIGKRRMVQPAFHKQRLEKLLMVINQETSSFINRLSGMPLTEAVNISEKFQELSISIITRVLCSTPLDKKLETIMGRLDELTGFASTWMKSLIKTPLHWPTPPNRKFMENCRVFDEIIYDIVDSRQKYRAEHPGIHHDDLLDMLLDQSVDSSGRKLSRKELRDEITTLFMAGYETVSQTLSWIMYHLARDKEFYKRQRQEGLVVIKDSLPTLESLSELVFTKQIIQEGLRRYPSIPALVRRPYKSEYICGVLIPPSANVLINLYGMHHHQDYWEKANEFYPGHFNSGWEETRPSFVYLPFGGGPRLCIGNGLAMMILQVVVSRLCIAFEFDVPHNFQPEIEPNITMRVKGGIKLFTTNVTMNPL